MLVGSLVFQRGPLTHHLQSHHRSLGGSPALCCPSPPPYFPSPQAGPVTGPHAMTPVTSS